MNRAIAGGAKLNQIGNAVLEVAKIQHQRTQSAQKGPVELLRKGLLGKSKSLLTKKKDPSFSIVPNDAPDLLSNWKSNSETLLLVSYTNAAA